MQGYMLMLVFSKFEYASLFDNGYLFVFNSHSLNAV